MTPSPWAPPRSFAAVLALALVLVVTGCGGDDDESAATTETQPPPTSAERAPTVTEPEAPPETEPRPETEPEAESEPPEPDDESDSPEDQPGGAGDEEPARTLALFTGEDGRITPRRIRVPAFISIRVELRSTDEQEYGLRFDGHTIRVSGGLSSVSTTIDGLRPGKVLVARPFGASTNGVRIEATAEPGP